MAVNAFLKALHDQPVEIRDLGFTVVPDELYPLLEVDPFALQISTSLPGALMTGAVQMIGPDGTTAFDTDAALAVLNGADLNDPFLHTHNINGQSFRMRFTFAERMAIDASELPAVVTLRNDLMKADVVDLSSSVVAEGLDMLIANGLLNSARKDELLSY